MSAPDDPFARATALHEAGRIDEAMRAYRDVPDESPFAFKALNNLGTLLEQQNRLNEAVAVYQRAVELRPDSFVLHYNLAYALHRQGRLPEAVHSYRHALQLNPDLTLARYNLGNALYDQQQFDSAADEFRRVSTSEPGNVAGHRRLGDALFKLRRIPEALQAYQHALQREPESPHEHFNLGKALHLAGRPDEAIAAYRRSIELEPRQSAPYENLGRLLSRLGRRDEAAAVYRQWQAASPDNPVPSHLLAALTADSVPSRASDEYIRTAFDQFADDFDTTLQRLNYRAPQLLIDRLAEVAGPPAQQLEILDAGCGTGLCGPLLRPFARRLVGVDLSASMLDKARSRNVYDDLLAEEITAYLEAAPDRYDAIVAADVFVYFGELTAVASAAFAALRPGGWLLLTLERLDDAAGGFRLNPHGRYSHAGEYVARELTAAGFAEPSVTTGVLRTEGGEPVEGLVVAARKPG